MRKHLVLETSRAIQVERDLVSCLQRLLRRAVNPRMRKVIHDLIVMEEMNEMLLRSLTASLVR